MTGWAGVRREIAVRCPYCRHADSRVVDSREADDGQLIRRRRSCPECGKRFTTASRADNPPAGPARTVVVQSGDTLWDIAARVLPRRNNQDAVAELRDLNHLAGYDVQPGEVLTLPR